MRKERHVLVELERKPDYNTAAVQSAGGTSPTAGANSIAVTNGGWAGFPDCLVEPRSETQPAFPQFGFLRVIARGG